MISERRSVEGELPDGVADREHGYSHNPNPADEVAANRARFEQKQRELQEARHALADALHEVQDRVEQQYEEAMHDPAHRAMIPEQLAHQQVDPMQTHGGQEDATDRLTGPTSSGLPDVAPPGTVPMTPRAAPRAPEDKDERNAG